MQKAVTIDPFSAPVRAFLGIFGHGNTRRRCNNFRRLLRYFAPTFLISHLVYLSGSFECPEHQFTRRFSTIKRNTTLVI
jgi:hypothetical protein